MKLYLVSSKRVHINSLPRKIEDAYLLNYSDGQIEESVTLQAVNGKWQIKNNLDFTITSDSISKDIITLENNSFYKLKFNDLNEELSLYAFDTPMNYGCYDINSSTIINIGRDSNNTICYNNMQTSMNHATIIKDKGFWCIKSVNNAPIYVNNERVNFSYLNNGDIIFINGLKIIWMTSFIKINNSSNNLKINLNEHKEYGEYKNNYSEVKESEKNAILFTDNDVFFHTPRIKERFVPQTISITNPPEKDTSEEPPMYLTLGATIVMGLASSMTGVIAIFNIVTKKDSILSSVVEIFVCIGMLLGSILFPVLLEKYNKKKKVSREKNRVERYEKYLNEKKELIQKLMNEEYEILFKNYLSIDELKNMAISKNTRIWEREITDEDFLTIRLGIGEKKANIEVVAKLDEFSLEDDFLKDEVKQIVNTKYVLKDVPITINLTKNVVTPLIIENSFMYRNQFINSILLQLIAYHSGIDLKIVIITNEENERLWSNLKSLNHLTSYNLREHFFATNNDELKEVSLYLEDIYNKRYEEYTKKNTASDKDKNNEFYTNYDNYYLIITDDYLNAKKATIVDNIIKNEVNVGFSILMIDSTIKNVPSVSDNFIQISKYFTNIFNKNITDNNVVDFKLEAINEKLDNYINVLSNIPVESENQKNSMPDSINFLEMMKVGKIEQLNIMNRWAKNDPTSSLATPIGIGEDGKQFMLDLHEKFYGPHGLIAGATGSGKSEFIITYILSLAINYNPYEVQFVLIDYKGGGLAGAFENKETKVKLPHLVGTITNLDTGEMNRAIVSIRSELKRRQRMFNEARDKLNESTIDIYKYQKFIREGKLENPISHLFIISDEFAELKAQQPEFMDELISIARIGRSLGVHLILATQKPAGVVDDQIWSNARFKVSLKVQTAEDSVEMLKRPEAAEIKETGRFYLQVGYNELFLLGQSAWAGARYIPSEIVSKPIDDSIKIIDNVGNVIKEIKDEVQSDNNINLGDQLTNIVKYLSDLAIRKKIQVNGLWLPNIPDEIYLANTIKKYNYKQLPYVIEPLIGEYDDPSNQVQSMLTINFMNTGNLIIIGNNGSGKENLLTTIIYTSCLYHKPEEVNFYILDLGAEVLRVFKDMPHVGDVVLQNDKEEVHGLIVMLVRELSKRKELFSNYGGTYEKYINSGNDKLPMMFFILNGYESFTENFSDYEDTLNLLLRESYKYGIIVIITMSAVSSMRSNVIATFQNKIMMQVGDKFDYNLTLDSPLGLVPKKAYGRGLVKIDKFTYEFQTDFIYYRDKINEVILSLINKYKDLKKAPIIPVIPKKFRYENVIKYITNMKEIPIGIDIHTADVIKYNFIDDKITQIIGNSIFDNMDFIIDLSKTLSTLPNLNVEILDLTTLIQEDIENINIINEEYSTNISLINSNIDDKIIKVCIVVGVGYIYDRVLDSGIEYFNNMLFNSRNNNNLCFILIDNYSNYKRVENETWYSLINKKHGIWIGTGVLDQDIIDSSIVKNYDANEEFNGLSYSFNDNGYNIIRSIGTEDDDL